MSRQAAAQHLRTATAAIIEAYRTELRRLGSPLATRDDAWQQCRYQAQNIVAECAQSLETGRPAEATGVGEYSRLLGAHRVTQQIPVSESVRAAEVLWQAMQEATTGAAALMPAGERHAVQQEISTTFRTVTGRRLYQGIRGYEEATRPTAPVPAVAPAPVFADGPPRPSGTGPQADPDAQALESLTLREREILTAVREGLTNRQISRRFEITEATVKRHLHNAYRKLGINSRVQALNKTFGDKS
ncbi:LuxR C-terminal-related transcriptional regulator [Streptomyces sp. NPDC093546]|uniref:helix-turn-helix transcriptional regulator n=1 Tax=Streptomyces sp. NPDC093546 TaxID=3366040 RepID=UPI0037F64664